VRILYVEDNATNVILVQRVANMGKHEVINYDNGQDALDRVNEIKPDLVLLDVQLRGDLTGLDVARILREKACILPIIAVTAYAMKGDRQRCLDAGCDDYLPKPISVAELVTVFKRYGDAVASGKPILSSYKAPAVADASADPELAQPKVEIVPVAVPAAPVEVVVPAADPVATVAPLPVVVPALTVTVVDTPATIPPTDPVAHQTPTPVTAEP
jgi:two-component system cell cycle response regulator DivK